jgi:hypothetical protein
MNFDVIVVDAMMNVLFILFFDSGYRVVIVETAFGFVCLILCDNYRDIILQVKSVVFSFVVGSEKVND